MWPFGRGRSKPEPQAGPPPAAAPVNRRDWTGLPPIQRTIAEHPLTAPSDRFSDALATHHDPSISSDQMGHQVSADAPSGIVLTVARTATTRRDGPAMIPRPPVQRRAQDALPLSGEWNGDDEAAPVAARPAPLPVPTAIQRTAHASGSPAASPPLPSRSLPIAEQPVIQPLAEAPSLTSVPPDVDLKPIEPPDRPARSAPLIQPAAVQRTEVHEIGAPPRLTLGQARRMGLGAPIRKVPDRTVQRAAAEALPAPFTPVPVPESAAPPPAVERPIASHHAEPSAAPLTISRSAEPAASPPAAPPLELPLAPPARRPESVGASSIIDEPAVTSREAVHVEPVTPPSPTPDGTESASFALQRSQEMAASSGPRPADGEPIAAEPATATAPLLRPMALGRSLQRSTSESFATPALSSEPRAPLVSQRPLQPTAAVQRAVGAAVGNSPSAPSPRRQLAADPGPTHSLVLPSMASSEPLAAGERLAVAPAPSLQRSAAASLAAVPLPTSALRPAPLALASRTVTRAQPDSASLPPGQAEAARAAMPLAPPVIIQRSAADPSAESPAWPAEPGASLQRAVPVDEAPAESAPPPAAAGAAATSSGSSAGSATTAETDLDQLAGRLYDRIRSRLRSELLVDRERAGVLTDWR